jgi:PKD repeat protein
MLEEILMRVSKLGLFVFLSLILSACFRQVPPKEELGTQALPALIAAITPADNATGLTPLDSITIQFTSAMNKTTVERSISVYTGKYNLANNPTTFTKLQLTAMCNGKWRVRNPNTFPLSFTWDVYNTTEKGVGVVPGNTDVFFYTSTGSKTVRVFIGTQQQQVKASNATTCTDAPFTFAWNADSKSVTITPNQPLAENTDVTVALSTLVQNVNNSKLPNPYSFSFSTVLPTLSEPWQAATINAANAATPGTPTLKGYASYNPDTQVFTLKSKNTSLTASQKTDPLYFVYQSPDKDATLTARVQLIQPFSQTAKAGLMLRQSNEPSSPFVYLYQDKDGIKVDSWLGGDTQLARANGSSHNPNSPVYLKVERKEGSVHVYESGDGVNWVKITTIALTLTNPYVMGLAQSDTTSTQTTQAQYEQVQLQLQGTPALADFTFTPESGQAPVTVNFDASASQGSNLTYIWDFGDGTAGTGKQVSHNYTSVGCYMATLKLSDGVQTVTKMQKITVASPSVNGAYTLEPGGLVISDICVAVVAPPGLLSKPIHISVNEIAESTGEHSLEAYNVVGKFYKVDAPDIFDALLADDFGLRIGLPVPEDFPADKVSHLEGRTLVSGKMSLPPTKPHWINIGGYYHIPSNMIFVDMAIGLPIVLVERVKGNTPLWQQHPWESQNINRFLVPEQTEANQIVVFQQQATTSNFYIDCADTFSQAGSTACENSAGSIAAAFDGALQLYTGTPPNGSGLNAPELSLENGTNQYLITVTPYFDSTDSVVDTTCEKTTTGAKQRGGYSFSEASRNTQTGEVTITSLGTITVCIELDGSTANAETLENAYHELFHSIQVSYDGGIAYGFELNLAVPYSYSLEGMAALTENSQDGNIRRNPSRPCARTDFGLYDETDLQHYNMQDFWLFTATKFGADNLGDFEPFLEVDPSPAAINTLLTTPEGQARLTALGLTVPPEVMQGGLAELVWQFNQNQAYIQDPITCGTESNSVNSDAVEVTYLTDGTVTSDIPAGGANLFCIINTKDAIDPPNDFNPITNSASNANLKLMQTNGKTWFRNKYGDICVLVGNTDITPDTAAAADISPVLPNIQTIKGEITNINPQELNMYGIIVENYPDLRNAYDVFSFENGGTANLIYSISGNASWLKFITPTSGTLAVGEVAATTVKATCPGNSANTYQTSVVIEDTDTGQQKTVVVNLECITEAVSVDPSSLALIGKIQRDPYSPTFREAGSISFTNIGSTTLEYQVFASITLYFDAIESECGPFGCSYEFTEELTGILEPEESATSPIYVLCERFQNDYDYAGNIMIQKKDSPIILYSVPVAVACKDRLPTDPPPPPARVFRPYKGLALGFTRISRGEKEQGGYYVDLYKPKKHAGVFNSKDVDILFEHLGRFTTNRNLTVTNYSRSSSYISLLVPDGDEGLNNGKYAIKDVQDATGIYGAIFGWYPCIGDGWYTGAGQKRDLDIYDIYNFRNEYCFEFVEPQE